MKRTLLTLFAVFFATAMALPANAQSDLPNCDEIEDSATISYSSGDKHSEYLIEYCGRAYDAVADETTFLYRVSEVGDTQDLSHWTLSLCAEALASYVSGTPEDGLQFGFDGSTGFTGVKWNTGGSFESGEFSFVLDGNFGVDDDVIVVAKGGRQSGQGTDTIKGPSCEQELCLPDTIPFWDDNENIEYQPAMAFIKIGTPNGFEAIEIVEGSQNIVLLDADVPVVGSMEMSSDFADGWKVLTYAGPEFRPTSLTVKFGPEYEAGSTFMFRVIDQYGCEMQVDPQIDMTVPETVELRGNYPNPFNPTTNIEFSVPEAMDVQLDVYDAMGRLVKSLVNDNLEAGVHNVSWNGTDAAGRQVASGAYFYRVQTGSLVKTKQMILLK